MFNTIHNYSPYGNININYGNYVLLQSNQGFPQVLQTWGGSSKFDGGGLSQNMGGSKGELKMLSKNTCERVHFIAKLPAVSLQASKLKMNFFTHIFQGFQPDFKLFIVLFQELFHGRVFHVSMGGGGCFSDGGLIFKWGHPMGGISFGGGKFCPPTIGNW